MAWQYCSRVRCDQAANSMDSASSLTKWMYEIRLPVRSSANSRPRCINVTSSRCSAALGSSSKASARRACRDRACSDRLRPVMSSMVTTRYSAVPSGLRTHLASIVVKTSVPSLRIKRFSIAKPSVSPRNTRWNSAILVSRSSGWVISAHVFAVNSSRV